MQGAEMRVPCGIGVLHYKQASIYWLAYIRIARGHKGFKGSESVLILSSSSYMRPRHQAQILCFSPEPHR